MYATIREWRDGAAPTPVKGSRHTLQTESMFVWYLGCVGCVSTTLSCHWRRHARWTHSFEPRHMHGEMSSPSLEKQNRQTDSCARSGSPSAPWPPPVGGAVGVGVGAE